MKDRCLTDEEIAAYLDRAVDAAMRKRIEQHLCECALCLHHVAELKYLVDEQGTRPVMPTAAALARAESIVARHTQVSREFDIAAVIKSGICRIVESTGNLLPPRRLAAVPIRNRKRSTLSPRIAKSLSGYLITVELVPRKDTVRPQLTVVEETSSARPDGIKARLYSPGACETKYSQKGRITFPPLGPGSFKIEIEGIGTIGLEVK